MRASEERFRTLFEDSSDAIVVTSQDGRVVATNQAAQDLFGFTTEEAIGSNVGDRFADPADRERFREAMSQSASVREFEVRLLKSDWTEMDCLLAATRHFDADGSSLGVQCIIHDISERKRAEETSRELAVLGERNRMAREIHDTLAQGFTGIVLQLEAAEQAMEGSPLAVGDHLGRAKTLARDSLQEARRSVWDLLPKALESQPIDAALQEEVQQFASAGREKAHFNLSGKSRHLPTRVQTALLRICQESLTNIRRHAGATDVRVDLTFHPDAAHLEVHDNGDGFDFEKAKASEAKKGFGLVGMEQRARLLGGTFSVKSDDGMGTVVEVSIPAS